MREMSTGLFLWIVGGTCGAVFAGVLAWGKFSAEASAPLSATALQSIGNIPICVGTVRTTCVVDGDTIWIEGVKIRIADIDTPEIGEPKCESERALGHRAKDRLRELLNTGPFELVASGRDEDKYGRKLRVVVRDGRSLGDQLVAEGLARTWSGRREPWC
ncbi:thermonuclease family protein [Shinella sp. CPCC 101442]|uniref:thermonuclease family protein n=1 Tax=Shinella sp. CPCC 101442 TaxID=2932265 RepID=UPI002152DDAB|nr:thermonuclease family protein [Shinella sp. CPCC 101442]MCR6502549.1 thermonuclease family protein [Shinella sp. CPCC 101442]